MNEQERIELNKKKLEEKFGKINRMGGKGTQRTVGNKKAKKTSDDKNIKSLVQKLNAQPLPEIQCVNLFTDDDQVIQLEKPEVFGSFQNKTLICNGASKKVHIKDCLADVISEVPPQQLEKLKASNQIPKTGESKTEEPVDKKEQPKIALENFEDVANN